MSESDIEVVQQTEDFYRRYDEVCTGQNVPLICRFGGSVLEFAGTVFPVGPGDMDAIYAKTGEFEADDMRYDFDNYGALTDDRYQMTATYGLAGRFRTRAIEATEEKSKKYDRNHWDTRPEIACVDDQWDAAGRAHFARRAFIYPHSSVYTGTVGPGDGLIVPMRMAGPYVATNISTMGSETAGKYIKMVMPGFPAAEKQLRNLGFQSLGKLVTASLARS